MPAPSDFNKYLYMQYKLFSLGLIVVFLPVFVFAQYAPPAGTLLPEEDLAYVIEGVMLWLLGIIGFIGVIAFVISGMQYLLSAGDQNMIDTAKRNMKWSIVGVIVAIIGFVIIRAADAMLRGSASF